MEFAKITSKGQVTIPIAIRRKLGVKEGDKLLFIEEGGRIYLANSSMEAFKEIQRAFQGVAQELGIQNEQDVVDMADEIREERSGRYTGE